MELGISSYTFPWAFGIQGFPQPKNPLNAIRLLEKAESLGVNVVQICDNFPLHKMEDGALNELSKTARDMGITIEVGTRGVEPENLLTYLKIAKKLNAKLLRTVFEVPGEKPGLNRLTAQIKTILPLFEKEGVYIALENYEQFKSKELALLVRRLNSSYVGVCLDTVNSFGALEGLEEVVNRLAAFTINLHLKDFDIVRVRHKMGFKIIGRPVGEGRLNIDWLFKVLKRKGRTPNIIIELWVPFLGSIEKTILKEEEWAIRSIEYLKRRLLE